MGPRVHPSGLTGPTSLLPPLAERRRSSGDQRRRTVAPRGRSSAGMDPPDWGGSFGGREGDGGGGMRRRRASRRTAVSVGKGVPPYGGSRSSLSGWVALLGRGEADGGAGRAGEALPTAVWTRGRRRPKLPEMRKTASLPRFLATGAPGRWPEAVWGSGRTRGSLNRWGRSVPAAADRNAGEPPLCCGRATWRRLAVHGVAAGARG